MGVGIMVGNKGSVNIPRKLGVVSTMLSLDNKGRSWVEGKALVRISTNCCLVGR